MFIESMKSTSSLRVQLTMLCSLEASLNVYELSLSHEA